MTLFCEAYKYVDDNLFDWMPLSRGDVLAREAGSPDIISEFERTVRN